MHRIAAQPSRAPCLRVSRVSFRQAFCCCSLNSRKALCPQLPRSCTHFYAHVRPKRQWGLLPRYRLLEQRGLQASLLTCHRPNPLVSSKPGVGGQQEGKEQGNIPGSKKKKSEARRDRNGQKKAGSALEIIEMRG